MIYGQTDDRLFLLTIEQAEKLPEEIRRCKAPDDYKCLDSTAYKDENGYVRWWLASGSTVHFAKVVYPDGRCDGSTAVYREAGVRPALRMDTETLNELSKDTDAIYYVGYEWFDISEYIGFPCLLMKMCLPRSKAFDGEGNNYRRSDIRAKLNKLEKKIFPVCSETKSDTTEDLLFLLTIAQAEKLPEEIRRCKAPDDYDGSRNRDGNCCWWLCSPGDSMYHASTIDCKGCVDTYGFNVHYHDGGVRPALRIESEVLNIWPKDGDTIYYMGYEWFDISEYIGFPCLLMKTCLPKTRCFDEDSNDYGSSAIKSYLNELEKEIFSFPVQQQNLTQLRLLKKEQEYEHDNTAYAVRRLLKILVKAHNSEDKLNRTLTGLYNPNPTILNSYSVDSVLGQVFCSFDIMLVLFDFDKYSSIELLERNWFLIWEDETLPDDVKAENLWRLWLKNYYGQYR